MSIPTRILVLVFPAAVIGCATTPADESYDSPVGKWTEKSEKSSGGTITSRLTIFDESSAEYRGSFNARVEFFAADDLGTWQGYWVSEGHASCLQEKGGSNSWGETIYRFNQTYTRYEGTWDYCGQDRKYTISGVRR